jgi:hypothetical protein
MPHFSAKGDLAGLPKPVIQRDRQATPALVLASRSPGKEAVGEHA